MRDSGSLGDLVRAELAPLGLRDTDLVERLCAYVDSAAAGHGLDADGDVDRVSAVVGGALALTVLEGIESGDVSTQSLEKFDELKDLQDRAAMLRADPDNIESLSFRDLARRLVRGRRGE